METTVTVETQEVAPNTWTARPWYETPRGDARCGAKWGRPFPTELDAVNDCFARYENLRTVPT